MAGDEDRARVAGDRALQHRDHAGVVDDARLVVEPPLDGVHQAVVRLVHRLVHPDRVGHVDADRHSELAAALEERRQPRVVEVEPARPAEPHPEPLVALLAYPACALPVAALELADRRGPVARLIESGVVEAAPELEAVLVPGVQLHEPVKLVAVGACQEHRLVDADRVHHLDPAVDLLCRLRVTRVRVHVDHRMASLLNVRDRDLVEHAGPVILEPDLLGRLRRGGLRVREVRRERERQDQARVEGAS
jgi:hypothetical protein